MPVVVKKPVGVKLSNAPLCTVTDFTVTEVLITGSLATFGIVTSSVSVGTVPSRQLPGVVQSVETHPVQVSVVVVMKAEFKTTGLFA